MAKFNEMAYMVYDKLGINSDDSRFEIDHIIFMLNTWRAQLLKQQYTDQKKNISNANYQTICVNLENAGDCLSGDIIKSVEKVPNFLNIGTGSVNIVPTGDRLNNIEFTLVDESRIRFVGNNKWLKKIIYFALANNNYMYLKSANPDFKYLKTVKVEALFDDPLEAAKWACENEDKCNWLESEYPLEESLVPILIDIVYSKLMRDTYNPEDKTNDANDDLTQVSIDRRQRYE